MPPKAAKKKGGKKGKSKEKKAPKLPEVDKTFYELEIAELNRRLARLRTENATLATTNEELQTTVKSNQEDRDDVIEHLKRTADQRIQEAEAARAEVKQLQAAADETERQHRHDSEMAKQEYRLMHQHLTNEIKLLNGKLNSLDEFRALRDELMRKFLAQEKSVEENSKAHARQVYELERKLVEGRHKLKMLMEQKLMQLSDDFHDAAEICISDTTRRVIRENIALNNELDQMMSTQNRLQSNWDEAKKRDKELVMQAKVDCDDIAYLYKSNHTQKQLLKRMRDKMEVLLEKMDSLSRQESAALRDRAALDVAQRSVDELRMRLRIAEQNLHALRCAAAQHAHEMRAVRVVADSREEVIRVALLSVRAVLKLLHPSSTLSSSIPTTTTSPSSTPSSTSTPTPAAADELRSTRARALRILGDLERLLGGRAEQERRLRLQASQETVRSLEQIYRIGDLGFTPPLSEKSVFLDTVPAEILSDEGRSAFIGSGHTLFETEEEVTEEGEMVEGSVYSVDFAASVSDACAGGTSDVTSGSVAPLDFERDDERARKEIDDVASGEQTEEETVHSVGSEEDLLE